MLDLRDFLEKLEEHGEIQTIDKEIHWDQEAAAICAMANRTGAPAVSGGITGQPNWLPRRPLRGIPKDLSRGPRSGGRPLIRFAGWPWTFHMLPR